MILLKIFITGAASGIGYALAKRLARQGHYIYISVHTEEQIITTVEKVKEFDYLDRISVMKLDITNEEDRKLITKLDIDCLVNLVGIGIGGSLLNLSVNKIRKNFDVNFFSTLEMIKLYISSREKKKGKVIITSSLAGFLSLPFLGSYCSSKSALSSFIECFNKELRKTSLNIKLKLIEPGAYFTGFNQYMLENKEHLDNRMFKEDIRSIIDNQRKLFSLIEEKSLTSVVNTLIVILIN